ANSPDTSPTVAGAHAIGKTSSRKSAGAPERRVEVESHRAAAPVPEKPRLSPERQREVEKLYTAGLAAMSERRVDDALRYWELAWSMDPGYKRLAEYLKREYLIRGMEFFASGKLDDAMSYWQKALQMDPTDTRAASYIARARTQQARTRELTGADRCWYAPLANPSSASAGSSPRRRRSSPPSRCWGRAASWRAGRATVSRTRARRA